MVDLEVRKEITNGDKSSCPYCDSTNVQIKKNKFKGRILGMSKSEGQDQWYPNLPQAQKSSSVYKWYPNLPQAQKSSSVYKNVAWCTDCGEVFKRTNY